MTTDYLGLALAKATDPEEIARLQKIIADSAAEQIGIARMIAILKEHQISMGVSGCGCCGSPRVDFSYKGEQIVDANDCSFSTGDGT